MYLVLLGQYFMVLPRGIQVPSTFRYCTVTTSHLPPHSIHNPSIHQLSPSLKRRPPQKTKRLPPHALSPIPLNPRHPTPRPDQRPPVTRLGRLAQVPPTDHELPLSPRDLRGHVGVLVEPTNRSLEIRPVRLDKNDVGFGRGVRERPGRRRGGEGVGG